MTTPGRGPNVCLRLCAEGAEEGTERRLTCGGGGGAVLGREGFQQLVAKDADVTRGIDAEADVFAADLEDDHFDRFTDLDGLTDAALEDKHLALALLFRRRLAVEPRVGRWDVDGVAQREAALV